MSGVEPQAQTTLMAAPSQQVASGDKPISRKPRIPRPPVISKNITPRVFEWESERVRLVRAKSESDVTLKYPPGPHIYRFHPLHLTTLNLDVQHEIMSWLPTPSLSALMRSCRHFAVVALRPLCRRSGEEPLRDEEQLRSFLAFLRTSSSSPRSHFIRELHISLPPDLTDIDEVNYYIRGQLRRGTELPLLAVTMVRRILRPCHNLRRLRIDSGFRTHDDYALCLILAKMTSLTDLWMPYPGFVANYWRELGELPIRTLTFEPPYELDDPTCLDIAYFSIRSVVELRLPMFHGWNDLHQRGVVFPQVQRLTSGYPGSAAHEFPNALCHTFPNLKHLVLTGSAFYDVSPRRREIERVNIEDLRCENALQWKHESDQHEWPALASISCNHPCTLYALAIPIKIPSLSMFLMYEDPQEIAPIVRRAKAVIGDLRPSCLELRLCLTEQSCKVSVASDDGAAAASCPELDILEGDLTRSSTIRSCVLTILHDYYSGDDEWRVAKHSDVVGILLKALSKLQITHVLIKYCSPHLLQHDAEELLDSDMPGDDQRAHRAMILVNGHTDAQRLASASRTLRWFGIYAEGDVLKSWEIERPQEPKESSDATAVLQEVAESRAWKILAEQRMEEFAAYKIPPWHPPGPQAGGAGTCFWGI